MQSETAARPEVNPRSRHFQIAQGLSALLKLHGMQISPERLQDEAVLATSGRLDIYRLEELGHHYGFSVGSIEGPLSSLSPLVLPALMVADDGQCLIVHQLTDAMAGIATLDLPSSVILRERDAFTDTHYRFIVARPKPDDLSRSLLPKVTQDLQWFWDIVWRYRSYYIDAIVATVIANFLTLATAFFSMNIYDRVIPNQAHVTLWTLSIGTLLAIALEFLIRWLKALLIDAAGKKSDLLINAAIFREVQRIQLEHRPVSIGSFTSSIRDFESIREFFSSATMVAITDLPFSIVFLVVIYLVAGPIVMIPLLVAPIVLAISWLAQPLLSKALRENTNESAQRQAVLVETLLNYETVKATRSEEFLQTRYEKANAFAAHNFNRIKSISSFVLGLSSSIQQVVNVVMIIWGVYLIETNVMTMGGLIAASMLSGRAIAPLAQIMGLATRFQQAKLAIETLVSISKRPKEKSPSDMLIAPERCDGSIDIEGLSFTYPGNDNKPVLSELNLQIAPGEHIGILGRIGSGKSTLLRLLGGLYQPTEGGVLIDKLNLQNLDLAVMRRHIAFLGQEPQLFHGTLRDNLVLTDTYISDTRIAEVLQELGFLSFVESQPRGINMPLMEGGVGLSGGQKQLIAVARTMLRNPKIVLLDEPTSAMDQNTEAQVLSALHRWLQGRTLVLVTHRPQLLNLVTRTIVMERGKIVMDGGRDDVIARLSPRAKA